MNHMIDEDNGLNPFSPIYQGRDEDVGSEEDYEQCASCFRNAIYDTMTRNSDTGDKYCQDCMREGLFTRDIDLYFEGTPEERSKLITSLINSYRTNKSKYNR